MSQAMSSRNRRIQWRYLFAAPLPFSFLCFSEVPDPAALAGVDPISPLTFFLAYLAGAIGGCLLLTVLPAARHHRLLPLSPYLCSLPLIAGFALAFSYHGAHFGTPLQVPGGAALVGIGSALLLARWTEAFCHLGAIQLAPTTAAMLAVAFLMKALFLPFSDSPYNLAVIGAFLLASAAPLDGILSRKPSSPKPVSGGAEEPFKTVSALASRWWKPMLGCALCCMIFGLTWGNAVAGGAPPTARAPLSLFMDIPRSITAVVLAALAPRTRFTDWSLWIAPVAAATILIGWMLTFTEIEVVRVFGYICTGIAFALFQISFWISTIYLAGPDTARARTLFCGAHACLGALIVLCALAAPFIDTELRELLTPICCVIFFTLLGITASGQRGAPTTTCDSASSDGHTCDSHASAAGAIAERYGLSQREHEVFALFVQGYSANHIAEQLTVSLHTVKTHVKRIYGKLGVHSKNELIALYNHWPNLR